eukprot:Nk52_evm55s2367 gene=Nk52_evmTU55s2367
MDGSEQAGQKSTQPAASFELGKAYNVKIGNTFRNMNSGFHMLRYDFKPASVDSSSTGALTYDEKGQTTLNFKNSTGEDISFQGSAKPCGKECILIFDPKSGTFTLEKLNLSAQVKNFRPARGGTSSVGGGGVSNNGNKHLNVPLGGTGRGSSMSPAPQSPTSAAVTSNHSNTAASGKNGGSSSPHVAGARGRSASPAPSPLTGSGFETSFKPLKVDTPQNVNNFEDYSSSSDDMETKNNATAKVVDQKTTNNANLTSNIADEDSSGDELDREVEESLKSAGSSSPAIKRAAASASPLTLSSSTHRASPLAVGNNLAGRAPTPLSLAVASSPLAGGGQKRKPSSSGSSSSSSSSDDDDVVKSGAGAVKVSPKKAKHAVDAKAAPLAQMPKTLSAAPPVNRSASPQVWQLQNDLAVSDSDSDSD